MWASKSINNLLTLKPGGHGSLGLLCKIFGGGVWSTSWNPHPISGQRSWFNPYFRPSLEVEMPILLSESERGAWHLRLSYMYFLHFDWPVETKAVRKLSKRCQKLIKNLVEWQRRGALRCNVWSSYNFHNKCYFLFYFKNIPELESGKAK